MVFAVKELDTLAANAGLNHLIDPLDVFHRLKHLLAIFLESEEEDMEASINAVCNSVGGNIVQGCGGLDDEAGCLIHVEDGWVCVEADRVQLIRLAHGDFSEGVKVTSLQHLSKLIDVFLDEVLGQAKLHKL